MRLRDDCDAGRCVAVLVDRDDEVPVFDTVDDRSIGEGRCAAAIDDVGGGLSAASPGDDNARKVGVSRVRPPQRHDPVACDGA